MSVGMQGGQRGRERGRRGRQGCLDTPSVPLISASMWDFGVLVYLYLGILREREMEVQQEGKARLPGYTHQSLSHLPVRSVDKIVNLAKMLC